MGTDEISRNWRDITYLHDGVDAQQRAFETLSRLQVLPALRYYDPVLVSTVCLNIQTDASDLDIICEVHDHTRFIADVTRLFGDQSRFSTRVADRTPVATIVQFFTHDFEIEIFGQTLPVEQQAAYLHLCQTYRVIRLGGEQWRSAIQRLKLAGVKTEPAVARLLALSGDPYQAVIGLRELGDHDLSLRIEARSHELPEA